MPGRYSGGSDYRYGFQGQEKDDEITGVEGSHLSFEYRVHDARLGRFLSRDPLAFDYPHNSPYAFSENRVIDSRELEGLELENINTSLKDPSTLRPQLPVSTGPAIQKQVYKVSVKNSGLTFKDLGVLLLKNPEKILSSSGAEFKPNFPLGVMQKGDNIKILIDGPFNDSYVRVANFGFNKETKTVFAKFVTLEGHVEKGQIQFSITLKDSETIEFQIYGISQSNNGTANAIDAVGDFARNEQTSSWLEVLNNFVQQSQTAEKETSKVSVDIEQVTNDGTKTSSSYSGTNSEINDSSKREKVATNLQKDVKKK